MDTEILVTEEDKMDRSNDALQKLPMPDGEGLALDKINGTPDSGTEAAQVDGNLNSKAQLEEGEANQSSIAEAKDKVIVEKESKHSTVSKKGEAKSKNLVSGNEKPSSPKHVVATWVKKNKDGKQPDADPVLNGKTERTTSAPSPTGNPKSPGKSGAVTSQIDASQTEGLKDQIKDLKPLKGGSPNKVEEHSHFAPLSPSSVASKPRRMGATPAYGFSFKCDERAEKRKEFFSKLEEKIHAQEVEKTTIQAKTKETQEAEIKQLRKNLTFKATPMPSFYREPPPPKVEWKKIPPTRAKSPKLGRRKSLPAARSEGNDSQSSQPDRLSLEDRVSHDALVKESISYTTKKPQVKSLPKLPSEKSGLENPADSCSVDIQPKQLPKHENEDLTAESKQDGLPATEEQEKLTDEELEDDAALCEPATVEN